MRKLLYSCIVSGTVLFSTLTALAQGDFNYGSMNQSRGIRFINSIEINPLEMEGATAGVVSAVAAPSPKETSSIQPQKIASSRAHSMIENCSAFQFKYAQLLDVEVESIFHSKLFDFIEDWLGTRYRYGGTDRKGIDCSAFTGRLLKDVYGLLLPRTARDQFHVTEMVANADLREGDLLFFNTRGGISHVGVYLGNQYFVHSSTSLGVTINSLREDYYSKRFLGAGRLRSVEEATAAN